MCSSVVKQKNSKKCCKAKIFLVPHAEPVCKAVFPPKIGPPQQGYFHGATYTEGLGATLLFAEGPFVSEGRSDLFSDMIAPAAQSAWRPRHRDEKIKNF